MSDRASRGDQRLLDTTLTEFLVFLLFVFFLSVSRLQHPETDTDGLGAQREPPPGPVVPAEAEVSEDSRRVGHVPCLPDSAEGPEALITVGISRRGFVVSWEEEHEELMRSIPGIEETTGVLLDKLGLERLVRSIAAFGKHRFVEAPCAFYAEASFSGRNRLRFDQAFSIFLGRMPLANPGAVEREYRRLVRKREARVERRRAKRAGRLDG